MKIGLVAFCAKKGKHKEKAKEIYKSVLFNYSIKYLKKRCDKVYILSAKYGLLNLDTEIEPYDVTLNKMKSSERYLEQ